MVRLYFAYLLQIKNTTSGSTTCLRWTPWGSLMTTYPSCTTLPQRLELTDPLPLLPRIRLSLNLVSGLVSVLKTSLRRICYIAVMVGQFTWNLRAMQSKKVFVIENFYWWLHSQAFHNVYVLEWVFLDSIDTVTNS